MLNFPRLDMVQQSFDNLAVSTFAFLLLNVGNFCLERKCNFTHIRSRISAGTEKRKKLST